MLDRYLLRYFLAVVDRGNFSRAAEACHVAQPTLSVGIAKLERIVGRALFVRSNQRVELTEAGARFLQHARRIEREFNAALHAVDDRAEAAPLRLGVLGSVPTGVIAEAVAATRPGEAARFELLFASERDLLNHLAKGRIDLALTLVERGGARFPERTVLTEGYALAMPAAHPLAGRDEIVAGEIADQVMIVRRHCEALSETSRHFTERGVRPHFALRSTEDERVLAMIAAGLGLTVMPDCFRHPGVVRPRLAGFTMRRAIGWMAADPDAGLLAAPSPLMLAVEAGLKGRSPASTKAA